MKILTSEERNLLTLIVSDPRRQLHNPKIEAKLLDLGLIRSATLGGYVITDKGRAELFE